MAVLMPAATPRLARGASRMALCAACLALAARMASGQAAAAGAREAVALRLHPHVGDTLRTRLEQHTEISGEGQGANVRRPMTTSVTVLARTIVQASRKATTTVLTVVDSAEVRTSDPHGAAMSAQAEKALRGQRLVLQLAEDGSVESARNEQGTAVPHDVAEAMAAMPAVFPHRSVRVGERWQREVPLPSAGPFGAGGSARVHAGFRLDSLGRNGELAFVSLRGEIVPEDDRRGPDLSGSMTGAMQVDRLRGWMTDSRFTLVVHSTVTPPGAVGLAPMRFVTRVVQRLRTMDKR